MISCNKNRSIRKFQGGVQSIILSNIWKCEGNVMKLLGNELCIQYVKAQLISRKQIFFSVHVGRSNICDIHILPKKA